MELYSKSVVWQLRVFFRNLVILDQIFAKKPFLLFDFSSRESNSGIVSRQRTFGYLVPVLEPLPSLVMSGVNIQPEREKYFIIITSYIALSIVADNLRALYRVRYYYPSYRTSRVKPDPTR